MKFPFALPMAVACLLASPAVPHDKVQNQTVLAWMDLMVDIADNTKALGQMANRETPFDVTAAQNAASLLAIDASRIAELFANQATDPHSEALPEIWEDFPDFTAHARALQTAAQTMSQITSLQDLQSTFPAIARSCLECHESYRKP